MPIGIGPCPKAVTGVASIVRNRIMKIRFSISLKLLLLILPLICLPIASTGYFSIHAAVDRVNRLVRDEQMAKLTTASEKLSHLFEKLQVDLETITALPVMEDYHISRSFRLQAETEFNRETIARLFEQLICRTPQYLQIQYLDKQGDTLIRVGSGNDSAFPKDERLTHSFLETGVPASEEAIFSDVVGGRDDQPAIMQWAKPVFSVMGEFAGVVVLDLDFDRIVSIVKEIHVGQRGYAVLSDQLGRIVVHPNVSPYRLSLQDMEDDKMWEMVKNVEDGATVWRQYTFGGEMKLAAFAPIFPIDWLLAVTIPTTEFKKEGRAIQKRVLEVVTMTLAIAVVSVSFLSYLILRPVRSLVAATKQLSAGDLGKALPVHANDELGDLTRSFNRMVKNLARTQKELVISEKLISMGRLSAGMAHEIRNPLNAIKGAIVHLRRRRPEDDLVQEYGQLVSEEIDRLNTLVTDFLYFSKQAAPKPVPTDLNQLILSVQQLFAEQARARHVDFCGRLARNCRKFGWIRSKLNRSL